MPRQGRLSSVSVDKHPPLDSDNIIIIIYLFQTLQNEHDHLGKRILRILNRGKATGNHPG